MGSGDAEIRDLYRRLLEAWNEADAEAFAAPFAEDGEVIGFDGSQIEGRATIAAEMSRIFADHETGAYVGKVRRVRPVGPESRALLAVAGMVPAGSSELDPKLNAVQSLLAERREGGWQIVLYQNTPARFDGRPELVESLTEELRGELP